MINILKTIILLSGDIFILYFSLFLTLYIRFWPNFNTAAWNRHFFPFTIIYLFWLIVFFSQNLYSARTFGNRLYFFQVLARALFINVLVSIIFFYFIPYLNVTPKTILFLDLIIFSVIFSIWRYIFSIFLKTPFLLKNILIIGNSKEIKELVREIQSKPHMGYSISSEIQDSKKMPDLKSIIEKENINTVCLDLENNDPEIISNLYQCIPLGVNFKDTTQFYEELTGKIPLTLLGQVWFLENLKEADKKLYEITKRGFDLIFAFVILALTMPLWVLTAILIKLGDHGSIFYAQKRIGKNGKIFTILKFRTMKERAEEPGKPLWSPENDKRITWVGKILRKAHIDEFPQFLLVISGEMSLVGPRPERPEFVENLEKKIPYYQIRHIIKPGVTGWAQINFRYGASTEDAQKKLQYELYYIKNRSLILDLSVFLKTFNAIIERLFLKKP